MSSTDRPTAAEDFAGYLRAYHSDAIDGDEPVEEVWDRYHLPHGTHRVNGRVWDRKKILSSLRSRRSLDAPFELHLHEVIVEGRRAAARYTIGTPMMWKLQSATDAAVFAELAEDGRVVRTDAFSSTRPGWSGTGERDSFDGAARPAPGTAPAPPPVAGAEPTPAQDPAHYLRAYYAAGYDPAVPAAEAHDRFHTPDALHQVGGKVMQRSGVLKALEDERKRGHVYPVEVHETLREGNRFAARYTTSRDGKSKRSQEVFAFGEFAPDGRVRLVRFLLEPGYGAA
ncbi:nuclear transport factor 2 family protein [Streptomyces sp. TRM43335]|uniref:Nuclear transport factor 2 family protein n=1 Tax=Streptomyces taklimakanensis TaxID=2569853 RepID=A0A6G2BBB2_9ACTN|nr:nuclear transport factor 2 family protein [Streptomyces taklimakanensis]MTE19565.1 nuclear transport factor 2 family protein [Streptomyces taklimakanensis]